MSITPTGIRRLGGATAIATVVAVLVAGCGTSRTNGVTGLGTVTASPTPTGHTTAPAPTPTPTAATTSPTTAIPTPTTPVTDPIFTMVVPFPILTLILPPATVSPDDCISYNPNTLAVSPYGTLGYQLSDGSSALLLVDSPTDAITAYNMARNFSQQCFIGRNNTRAGDQRYRYITDYWQGAGAAGAVLPAPDCIGYNNTTLTINNLGADGWQLVSGSNALLVLDTQADANKSKAVAAAHHNLCFIGRSNGRPNRYEYIVEYWK